MAELESPKFPSCLLMAIIKLVVVFLRLWPSERDESFSELQRGLSFVFMQEREPNKLTQNKNKVVMKR